MIENSKKKGFTLIELLIVIGIIMMISSIGVNGYISYRRESMLFFAVDSAVAQIKELRDKTIHGEYEKAVVEDNAGGASSEGVTGEVVAETNDAFCYGIYFKKDNAEDAKYSAEIFKEKYVGKKVWNAITRTWDFKGCSEEMTGFRSVKQKTRDFELDSSIDIKAVLKGENKTPVDEFILRFSPPEGDIVVYDGGNFIKDFNSANKRIEIQFGLSGSTRLQRSVLIDLQNSQFENVTTEQL